MTAEHGGAIEVAPDLWQLPLPITRHSLGGANAFLIRDREGIPVYSMGAIEDISYRKRAEMELQQLKERLQFLLPHPGEIFVLLTLATTLRQSLATTPKKC